MANRKSNSFRRVSGLSGFLLFEVLVSVFILSIGFIGSVRAFHHVLAISERAADYYYGQESFEQALLTFMVQKEGGMITESENESALFSTAVKNEQLPETEKSAEEETDADNPEAESVSASSFSRNTFTVSKHAEPLFEVNIITQENR